MRKIKFLVFSLLFITFYSCQPQGESFVKFNLDSNMGYLFVGEYYDFKVLSSEDVTAVRLEVDGASAHIDGVTYSFQPQEAVEESQFVLHAFNKDGEEVATNEYYFKIIAEPDVILATPVENQNIMVGEEMVIAGNWTGAIDHAVLFIDGREIETFNEQNFKYKYIFERRSGGKIKISFQDRDGMEIKQISRQVKVAGSSAGDDNDYDIPVYNRPWDNPHTAIVIDAYEGNYINWDAMATDERMVGIIHRSSDGLRVDKKYKSRMEIAKERGYLWGAYHLGRPGNVIAQAKLFLQLVGDDPETLMVLDLEAVDSSRMMNINEAIEFMEYVYEQTGRIPVIYANHSVTLSLNSRVANNPLFQRAPLWYARFRKDIPSFPTGIWDSYFLWQFSSEINCSRTGACLYNVPGTGFDMDINVFAGTTDQLHDAWVNPN